MPQIFDPSGYYGPDVAAMTQAQLDQAYRASAPQAGTVPVIQTSPAASPQPQRVYRLYIYYAPGIETDPATGTPIAGVDVFGNPHAGNNDGVYWTGTYEPASGCGSTPRGFQSYAQMSAYASAHGETLMGFQNGQQVGAFCGRVSSAVQPSKGPGSAAPAPGTPELLGGLSWPMLAVIGVALYALMRK